LEINTRHKTIIGLVILSFLVMLYIGIWFYYNTLKSISLKINNSEVEVKLGDIFSDNAELKAIAFNEYFDTLVDDIIIAKSSLNGIFIEKFYHNRVEELDEIILADTHMSEMIVDKNIDRSMGKKFKYKLGTICVINNYLITAFSRFDDKNRAYLEINDYINCLLNFWNEVDKVYAGKTVAIPVFGSGITRFKGYENISEQELLELIIWTFKVSRIKFTYPSKAKIVVYPNKRKKINFLALKDLGN